MKSMNAVFKSDNIRVRVNLYAIFIFIIMGLFSVPIATEAQDWANLEKYKVANNVLSKAGKVENRIIFMGNSITEFWSVFDSSFFVGKPYVNRGISGQTTPQMLIRFRPDVIDLQPAAVVILAGINDIAQNNGPATLEEISGNIFSMVELAISHNIKPVMCSVLPANDFYWRSGLEPGPKVIALNEMLKAYAEKNGITYVDYYSSMVDDKMGLKKEYGEDGVHPNVAGYKVMERILEDALDK